MKIKTIDNIFIRHNEIDASKQSLWFIHGFADSGLAYREVFDSLLVNDFNIYVLDLPGFGVSPANPNFPTIKAQADLLSNIISEETKNQTDINIVAHSIGSLIGTWISKHLNDRINYYFNVEGNLTEADSYFSSKPLNFETIEGFTNSFEKEIFEAAQYEERYKRYYSSLRFATTEGMKNWSFTSQVHIKDNLCGIEFKNLNCNKIYIWGDMDTPKETQDFILENNIPNRLFKNVGHWHMLENSEAFYNFIDKTIKSVA